VRLDIECISMVRLCVVKVFCTVVVMGRRVLFPHRLDTSQRASYEHSLSPHTLSSLSTMLLTYKKCVRLIECISMVRLCVVKVSCSDGTASVVPKEIRHKPADLL
jgi:hypothetical protein